MEWQNLKKECLLIYKYQLSKPILYLPGSPMCSNTQFMAGSAPVCECASVCVYVHTVYDKHNIKVHTSTVCTSTLIVSVKDSSSTSLQIKPHGDQLHHYTFINDNYKKKQRNEDKIICYLSV